MLKFTLILTTLIGSSGTDIANPEYEAWKKFKPGTTITLTTTTHVPGAPASEMGQIVTLGKVEPKKLVLKSKSVMKAAGKPIEVPAPDRDVPARLKRTPPSKAKIEKGKENVEAAGKKFACEWTKITSKANGQTTVTKMWRCDAVPGGIVKREMSGPGGMRSVTLLTKLEIK